jgi:hypothetical protein
MSEAVFKKLPPEALALGTPLAFFRNQPFRRMRDSMTNVLVFLLLGLSLPAIAGLLCFRAAEGQSDDLYLAATVLFAIGVGVLALTGYLLWPALRVAHVRGVVTFPNGLALLCRRDVSVVAWEQVDETFHNGRGLKTREGKLLELPDSLDGADVLGDLVLRETFDRLTRRSLSAISAGETVMFHPFRLSREGIEIHDYFLGWDELGNAQMRDGLLHLSRVGSWQPFASIPLASIRNYHVLWGLIDRAVAHEAKTPDASSASEEITAGAKPASAAVPLPPSDTETIGVDPVPPVAPEVPALQEPRVFSASSGVAGMRMWVGLTALLISALVLILGISMAWQAATLEEEAAAQRAFLCGGLMFFIGGFIIGRAALVRGISVRLTNEGLEAQGPLRKRACRWDEVEETTWEMRKISTKQAELDPSRLFHLRCRNGRRISLDDRIPEFELMMDCVLNQLVRCLLPRYLERLRNGQTLAFGPFVVTRDGIDCQTTVVEWSQIERAWIREGIISLTKHGSWIDWGKKSVTEVPNAHLLIALVNAILAGELKTTR